MQSSAGERLRRPANANYFFAAAVTVTVSGGRRVGDAHQRPRRRLRVHRANGT